MGQDFDCNDVLNLDDGIRFVGVCSKNGTSNNEKNLNYIKETVKNKNHYELN